MLSVLKKKTTIAIILLVCPVILMVATYGTLQLRPISLSPLSAVFERVLQWQSKAIKIDLIAPYVHWSKRQKRFYITADRVEIVTEDKSVIHFEKIMLRPSIKGLLREWRIVPAELTIETLSLVSSHVEPLALPINYFLRRFDFQHVSNDGILRYINHILVQDIVVMTDTLQRVEPQRQSEFLLLREGDSLRAVFNLDYRHRGEMSGVSGTAFFQSGRESYMNLEFVQMNPSDISGLIPVLAPLNSFNVPVNGTLSFNITPQGRFDKGDIKIHLEKGRLIFADDNIDINYLDLQIRADFIERHVDLYHSQLDIGGIRTQLEGRVDYQIDDDGQLKNMMVNLLADNISIDNAALFEVPVELATSRMDFDYDAQKQQLSIINWQTNYHDSTIDISGQLRSHNNHPDVDIILDFTPMTYDMAMHLWPVTIAAKTRQWVKDNISGQQVEQTRIHIDTDMADDKTIDIVLHVTDATIQYMSDFPPIEQAKARIVLGEKKIDAYVTDGLMIVPSAAHADDNEMIRISNGHFHIDDYHAPVRMASVNIDIDGAADVIIPLADRQPLQLLRRTDFDYRRIRGDLSTHLSLRFPLLKTIAADQVDVQMTAQSRDLHINGLINEYRLSRGRLQAVIDKTGLNLFGRLWVNGVDLYIDWEQSFMTNADGVLPSRMAFVGDITHDNLNVLGYDWAAHRISGDVTLNMVIDDGSLMKPTRYRFAVDLEDARFVPLPLAYDKPLGQSARLKTHIDFVNDTIGNIRFDYRAGDNIALAGGIKFDNGVISDLDIPSITLDRTRNLTIDMIQESGQKRLIINSEVFDVSAAFTSTISDVKNNNTTNRMLIDYINDAVLFELRADQLVGAYNESVDGAFLVFSHNGRHYEHGRLGGTFADGTEIIGELIRHDDNKRRLSLQMEAAGNALRLFNISSHIQGGSLLLNTVIHDDHYHWFDGQVTMVDFRVYDMPVLAKILSLASLTGFVDTLSGKGIEFKRAHMDYKRIGDVIQFANGHASGASIGLTLGGGYDVGTDNIDVRGRVIPAYGFNQIIGSIPIIGRILTGKKGEGLIAVSYRARGKKNNADVTVNPLTFFVPGIFRNIVDLFSF